MCIMYVYVFACPEKDVAYIPSFFKAILFAAKIAKMAEWYMTSHASVHLVTAPNDGCLSPGTVKAKDSDTCTQIHTYMHIQSVTT